MNQKDDVKSRMKFLKQFGWVDIACGNRKTCSRKDPSRVP